MKAAEITDKHNYLLNQSIRQQKSEIQKVREAHKFSMTDILSLLGGRTAAQLHSCFSNSAVNDY
jgi:hypothetical protein